MNAPLHIALRDVARHSLESLMDQSGYIIASS